MKILSVNSGSSSLRFTLFEMNDEVVIASGMFERIGIDGSNYKIKYNGEVISEELEVNDHSDAVRILLDKLLSLNIVTSYDDIRAIGHRILHGKDIFKESVFITDEVINKLESLTDLGPLHMKANIAGIKSFKEVLPDVPMVAVFDTSFHQTMDEEAYLYPVPYKWYEDYGVRKYGFHGTSYRYITNYIEKELGKSEYKAIVCHLGNGASISAIKDGKCIDTSMGFTPIAGIMMGTRSGDVDCSIIPYVMEKEGKNANEVIDDLNKKSGLLGLSQLSSDMRDIVDLSNEENKGAILAKNKFVRRVVDYIAQYYVLLEGIDLLVFTAGIGENNIPIRREVCEKLSCLGIKIDLDANNVRGEFVKISSGDSVIDVYVIPTNEELMIARDTLNIISR